MLNVIKHKLFKKHEEKEKLLINILYKMNISWRPRGDESGMVDYISYCLVIVCRLW